MCNSWSPRHNVSTSSKQKNHPTNHWTFKNNTHKLQMRFVNSICLKNCISDSFHVVLCEENALRFDFSICFLYVDFVPWKLNVFLVEKTYTHAIWYYTCLARFIIQTESFMTLFVALANWRARANAYVHFTRVHTHT